MKNIYHVFDNKAKAITNPAKKKKWSRKYYPNLSKGDKIKRRNCANNRNETI